MEKEFDDRTIWINDTTEKAVFRVLTTKLTGKKNSGVLFKTVEINPGERKALDSEYDSAIRTENAYGQVIGGLCPWLKKEGEVEVELHPCLDYKAVEEQIALEKLATKLQKDDALKDAIKVFAEQQVAEQNKKSPGRPKKDNS